MPLPIVEPTARVPRAIGTKNRLIADQMAIPLGKHIDPVNFDGIAKVIGLRRSEI